MNLIFDIGYNEGHFTQELLKLYPKAKVIGVDANKELLQGSNDERITQLWALVCDRDMSTSPFNVMTQSAFSSASADWCKRARNASALQVKHVDQVPTITLDKLIAIYGVPDLLKVDVEGFELEVFKGLKEYHPMKILFEFHEETMDQTIACIRYLQALGYSKWSYVDHTSGSEEYMTEPCTDTLEGCGFLKLNKGGAYHWGMVYCQ